MQKSILEILQPIVRARIAQMIVKGKIYIGHAKYEAYLVDSDVEQIILEGGPLVKLYISGLNVSGGTLSLQSEQLWADIRRAVKRIPDVWEPCLLIERNLMRVYQDGHRNRLKEKIAIEELVPLIPERDITLHTMSTTTFTDKETGESVTLHYNDDDYPRIYREARMALSQRRSARNIVNLNQELKDVQDSSGD